MIKIQVKEEKIQQNFVFKKKFLNYKTKKKSSSFFKKIYGEGQFF